MPVETIGGRFVESVQRDPNAVMFVVEDKQITRQEFYEMIQGLRLFFIESLVKPLDVVCLANTNQVNTFAAIFALWSLEASPLICDFRSTGAELEHLCQITNVAHKFSDFPRLARHGDFTVFPKTVTRASGGTELHFEGPLTGVADYIMSSGTTGLPKVSALNSGDLYSAINAMVTDGARGPWGNAVSCLSLSFPGARHIWFRNAISSRKIISVPVYFQFKDLDAALSHEYAEEATLPPVLIKGITDFLETNKLVANKVRYPNLVKLQSIGGPLVGGDLQRAYRYLTNRLVVTYSSTQTGVVSRLTGDDILHHPESVGRPLGHQQVRITDEFGHGVQSGTRGNIEVKIRDKWVATNDRGHFNTEGFLHIVGRSQDLLCRNGVSFYTKEVEDRIYALTNCKKCKVLGIPNGPSQEDLVVAVIEGNPIKVNEYCQKLRMGMTSLKRPDKMMVVNQIPVTSGLKIAQKSLGELISQNLEQIHSV